MCNDNEFHMLLLILRTLDLGYTINEKLQVEVLYTHCCVYLYLSPLFCSIRSFVLFSCKLFVVVLCEYVFTILLTINK